MHHSVNQLSYSFGVDDIAEGMFFFLGGWILVDALSAPFQELYLLAAVKTMSF